MNPSLHVRRHLFSNLTLAALLLIPIAMGCSRDQTYPSRPITLICPWAAGGGTDRVSRQMAVLLEQKLGQPVNVVNATGGKGVTGHSRGLQARPDGYTLTMMTLELSTMHWVGLTDLSYKDCEPIMSLNEDYAAIFVKNDAPWSSVLELEEAIRANPGTLTASGTAVGGAWHLAFAGWMNAANLSPDAATWIPSQGSNPSLQQLMSGGVDIVCCSLPEARTLLEGGEIRALGLMSPRRAFGFEDVATFEEQGRACSLGGWRGLGVPKGTSEEIVQTLVKAAKEIVTEEPGEGSFAQFMDTQKFDRTWRPENEFWTFLEETDSQMGELLSSESMKSVSEDRFEPMAYPGIVSGLLLLTLTGVVYTQLKSGRSPSESDTTENSAAGLINAFFVLGAVICYTLVAETAGFILTAGSLLLVLMLRLGTRPTLAIPVALILIPIVYLIFAFGLRVPLPQGWLG